MLKLLLYCTKAGEQQQNTFYARSHYGKMSCLMFLHDCNSVSAYVFTFFPVTNLMQLLFFVAISICMLICFLSSLVLLSNDIAMF